MLILRFHERINSQELSKTLLKKNKSGAGGASVLDIKT